MTHTQREKNRSECKLSLEPNTFTWRQTDNTHMVVVKEPILAGKKGDTTENGNLGTSRERKVVHE